MASRTDTTPAPPMTMQLRVAPGDAAAFETWRMGCAPIYDMDAEPPDARASFSLDCIYHQFADASLAAGAVTATELAAGAVTAGKIAAAAVTAAVRVRKDRNRRSQQQAGGEGKAG